MPSPGKGRESRLVVAGPLPEEPQALHAHPGIVLAHGHIQRERLPPIALPRPLHPLQDLGLPPHATTQPPTAVQTQSQEHTGGEVQVDIQRRRQQDERARAGSHIHLQGDRRPETETDDVDLSTPGGQHPVTILGLVEPGSPRVRGQFAVLGGVGGHPHSEDGEARLVEHMSQATQLGGASRAAMEQENPVAAAIVDHEVFLVIAGNSQGILGLTELQGVGPQQGQAGLGVAVPFLDTVLQFPDVLHQDLSGRITHVPSPCHGIHSSGMGQCSTPGGDLPIFWWELPKRGRRRYPIGC